MGNESGEGCWVSCATFKGQGRLSPIISFVGIRFGEGERTLRRRCPLRRSWRGLRRRGGSHVRGGGGRCLCWGRGGGRRRGRERCLLTARLGSWRCWGRGRCSLLRSH